MITTLSPRCPAVHMGTSAGTDAAHIHKQPFQYGQSLQRAVDSHRPKIGNVQCVNRPAEREVGQGHLGSEARKRKPDENLELA